MAMTIDAVHSALVTLLGDLEITSPHAATIKKVWPYIPPARQTMEEPSIILLHNLTEVKFQPGGMVEQQYDILLQLFGTKAEVDANVGAAVANAFLDAIITRLSEHVKLDGAVSVVRGLRGSGAGGTLAVLEWAGLGYVGLDLVIPITLHDVRTRAA